MEFKTVECKECGGTGGTGPYGQCEGCAGEGRVPYLTPEEQAKLIASAEKATAQLSGAGELEGSQIERFTQLLRVGPNNADDA